VGKGGDLPAIRDRPKHALCGTCLRQEPVVEADGARDGDLAPAELRKSLSEVAWLVHRPYKTVANTSSISAQARCANIRGAVAGWQLRAAWPRWRRTAPESEIMTVQTVFVE